MFNRNRPFKPSFRLQRRAFESLDLTPTPSTLFCERHGLPDDTGAEVRAKFEEAVAAQVLTCQTRVSTLLGQCEHLLAHLGHKPHRRDDFAKGAATLLTCLIDEMRDLVPRTDDDMELPGSYV